MNVARKEPAIPRTIVIRMPPGSFPGMMNFARAPAINPMMRVHRYDMLPPSF
jgi:hypothetical protein